MSNAVTEQLGLFATGYKMITSGDTNVFNERVNEALADGWVVYGGVLNINNQPAISMVKIDQRAAKLLDATMAMMAEQLGVR